MRYSLAFLLMTLATSPALALKTTAPAEASIDGRWTVNVQASEDGEALLAKRMQEIGREQRRLEERHRRRMQNDPFAWEPEFTPPADTPQFRARMEERDRSVRRMLGMTKFLDIKQSADGSKVDLQSEFETRRYNTGQRTQVSLPQGQLADSKSGWDGEWFVIERDANDGPRITEKFRRLKKTDQLEALVTIKGDSMLSGLKLRQIFDRSTEQPKPRDPNAGPIR